MKIIGSLALLIIAANLQAQTILKGLVTDSLNAPIPFASVYLAKTTYGTITNEQGTYSLNVPLEGTYELIASSLGYKSRSQLIKFTGQDQKINIRLSERPIIINEVIVKEKEKNRPQNYELFLKSFMGFSTFTPYTTIENSKDLIVYRDSEDKYLIAYSTKPLIITNSALGYKIIFDLQYFRLEFSTAHLRFSGNYYFIDISNQKRANSRTVRSRKMAYYGSRMHFLRALYTDSIKQENFEICKIERDSCNQKELAYSMQEEEIRLMAGADRMTLYNSHPVMIIFSDTHSELYPLPMVFQPRSYVSTMLINDSVEVYKNGYYPEGYNISWSGSMAYTRVAELLPYDYIPSNKVPK